MAAIGRVRCQRNKLFFSIIVALITVELIFFHGLHYDRTIFRYIDQKISRTLLVTRNCTAIKTLTHEKKNMSAVNDTLSKCSSIPPHRDIHIPKNCTTILMLTAEKKNTPHAPDTLPKCPSTPPNRVGCLNTYYPSPSFTELITLLGHLKPGGRYTPPNCVTDQRVAIVIPYRNREQHLRTVLWNLHLMLGTQQIDYGIFVIEQAGQNTFNRGLLMNIGYAEAIKTYNYTCFIFHDVDLIPEDDRIYYGCGNTPRHLSVSIDKFNYEPVKFAIGGVTQLPRTAVEKVNGFSNIYFGWGGEDDDLGVRIKKVGLTLERNPVEISRYRMLKHCREDTNLPNPHRHKLLKNAFPRMKSDGLNSLKYKLLHIEENKLYTNISVEFNKDDFLIPD